MLSITSKFAKVDITVGTSSIIKTEHSIDRIFEYLSTSSFQFFQKSKKKTIMKAVIEFKKRLLN